MPPYPPSLLDRLYDWLVALPGPTWLAYLVLAILSIVVANSAIWLSGLRAVGDIEPAQVGWGIATIGLLAGSHRLKVVAGAAFDDFRPALGSGVSDPGRARHELTVMPARPIMVITVFSFVITPLYYVADPVASQVIGLTPLGFIPRIISEGATSVILLAVLYQAVRQMRIVSRLHESADQIDPFRPAPLYAFSRLTAQIGLLLIGFNALGIVLNPAMFETSTGVLFFAPWLAAFTLFSIAVFVIPLSGMHRRLDTEKNRITGAADGRMRDLLAELNEAIDARATERVDGLDRTISALRHEREILAKLPTWPWSTGTIRGFASALFLPIGLFLIQRYLGALLGG
jgi:hypothetical protein